MKIIHLTPGTGTFHCGSCLRDNALIKALRRAGHDALMVPLYLPLVTDDAPASPELPVMTGGINLFLTHKAPLLASMLRPFRRWLDAPRLLRAVADRASMTSPRQLGEMTVESFRGLHGRQADEWRRLMDWIRTNEKPDFLSLSNGLLNSLAPAAVQELDIPVICSLQGEDSFLDTLPEPWRTQAWDLFRANSSHVTLYTAASEWYAASMRERLQLAPERIAVVPNGLDFSAAIPQTAPPEPPVIGFLARQCMGKGLHMLVDAYILVAANHPTVRLSIAGTCTMADDPFIRQQQAKLEQAGLMSRVQWRRDLSPQEKADHFRSLTLLSVPAEYGEAFGLYVIESLACGVPVVEPDHAGLAEVVRATGGGLLYETGNVSSLAARLEELLRDEPLRQQLASTGRAAVQAHYTADAMAATFAAVATKALAQGLPPGSA